MKVLVALLLLAAAAFAQGPVNMDVAFPPIADGTTDGTIDLGVVCDAIAIDAPDAYVKVQLWAQDNDDVWYRLRPRLALQPVPGGPTLPASPYEWVEFRYVYVWTDVNRVARIVYDRTDSTPIYPYGRRAERQ